MNAALADAPSTPVTLRLAPTWPRRWQDDGLCAQADPDLWFPERGASNATAMRICQACPVRAECLDYALEHEDISGWGIWGGVSERERRKLKRDRRAAA